MQYILALDDEAAACTANMQYILALDNEAAICTANMQYILNPGRQSGHMYCKYAVHSMSPGDEAAASQMQITPN